jgi:hypothetical protein
MAVMFWHFLDGQDRMGLQASPCGKPSSLSELICRKSGDHRRGVAFAGTTVPDAEQGFDFDA